MQSYLKNKLSVGVIMDGNGRWAQKRGQPRSSGHYAGISALRDVVRNAPDAGISSLTVYAFSSDNWKRPKAEVTSLMEIFRHFLDRELASLAKHRVRITAIGRRDRLPSDIVASIQHAEHVTHNNNRLHLRIALDYSGRDAIVRAAKQLTPATLSPEHLAKQLNHDSGPNQIDFLIRTGGETRLSDFLTWESAYAELYFTETLWPDFGGEDLIDAIDAFHARDRRFGALPNANQNQKNKTTCKPAEHEYAAT